MDKLLYGFLGVLLITAFIQTMGFALTDSVFCRIGVLHNAEDKGMCTKLSDLAVRHKATLCKRISLECVETEDKDLLSPNVIETLKKSTFIFDLSFCDQRSFALGEVLQTPFIALKPVFQDAQHKFLVSARFSSATYYQAIVDVLLKLVDDEKDDELALLFEETHYKFATQLYSEAREKEIFKIHLVPELDVEDDEEANSALNVLRELDPSHVLLLCSPDNLEQIMNMTFTKGIINDHSKWIIADMELSPNIRSLPLLKGLVGLRLGLSNYDPALESAQENNRALLDRPESSSIVLLNDTFNAVLQTMQQVLNDTGSIEQQRTDCVLGKRNDEKAKELLRMFGKTTFKSPQGKNFRFDISTRGRVVDRMDIMNIQGIETTEGETQSKMVKVGTWAKKSSLTLNQEDIEWIGYYWEEVECKYRKRRKRRHPAITKTLRIYTKIDKPFCAEINPSKKGNDRFEGFVVDLLKELSKTLKFNYTLEVLDDSYGSLKDGKWTGLIGELTKKKSKVDLVIGAITITAEREEVIDFSKPFMDFRLALIMPKPKGEEVHLFAFLLPFDDVVWLCTVAAVGAVTFFMAFLDHFSPYGHRAMSRQSEEGEGENTFSLFNSLWFATGSILGQGPDNMPRSGSGRVLAASFWFFTLILISTYTANLAAYFTAKEVESSIQSLDDLANQTKIKYGVLEGGSLYSFFEEASNFPFSKMFMNMNEWDTFMTSTKQGVSKVQKEGNFAYMTDQPYLDYYNSKQPCNTTLLTNLLEGKSYGIGLRRNSELTNDFSVAILKLREEGVVEKIRHSWWDSMNECPVPKKKPGSTAELTLYHVAGVFITLSGGMLASLLLLLMERKCKRFMSFIMKVESPAHNHEASERNQSDVDNRPTHAPQEMISNAEKRPKCNNRRRRRHHRAGSAANVRGDESSDYTNTPKNVL